MAKEADLPVGNTEAPVIHEIGREQELPAEVANAGVALRQDTVFVPPPVAQLGVKAVGPAAPPPQTTTIVLPLTDEQIAQGLHQSIVSSWRWLAEWCLRQLAMVHMTVKSVHGKIVRIKE